VSSRTMFEMGILERLGAFLVVSRTLSEIGDSGAPRQVDNVVSV
jgi:hypothetical protein